MYSWKIVGSLSEIRDALRFEREYGSEFKIQFIKRLDAWTFECWYV